MGLLSRIFRPEAPVETRAGQDLSWEALQALAPASAAVSARLAENLSTIMGVVGAIAGTLASLPAEIQRRTASGGWETDDDHPAAAMINDGPNRHQTWADWMEWTMASVLLAGNALVEVERDAAGDVRALYPIPWGGVGVQLLPSRRLAFDVTDAATIPGAAGRSRRILEDEVFFLRDRSDDGYVGRSRLQRAAAVLRPALDLQEFTGALLRNGINPSSVLMHPSKLTERSIANLRAQVEGQVRGPGNAAKTLILEEGLQWKQTSISPEDAEVLGQRRFAVEEIARIYSVPPPIVGDLSHGTFTNAETAGRWFATHTLMPWVAKIEGEFRRSIFSAASRRTHRLEIDLSGLLRGDPETRWSSHKIALETGALTVDEVRHVEGWAPRGEPAPAPAAAPEA